MPRQPQQDNERIAIRISKDDKAILLLAASIKRSNLTEFVLRSVLSEAKEVIEQEERIKLSKQDSLQVLDLLENPPEPTEALLKAAKALKERRSPK